MLVLSRRPDESIVLPSLGVRLQVLRVQGNVVRIGVEAPPHVPIRRNELDEQKRRVATVAERDEPGRTHAALNELHKLSLSLHLAQQEIRAGMSDEAHATLEKARAVLDTLQQQFTKVERHRQRSKRSEKVVKTLIVEDDLSERQMLAASLKLSGCECESAADGQDALDYLSTHDRPDFILLDMRLPRRSGPETLKEIRRDPRYRGVKIFAVTGANQKDTGVETGPNGVDAWFSKPVNPTQLWDAMRKSMEGGTN